MSPIILLGAYRSPPALASDLEISPCTAPHRDASADARCRALPPHPPRFPAQIEATGDRLHAASGDALRGEPGGFSFIAPLRRGLIAAGLLVFGALVGSTVTANAITARLAARRAPGALASSSTPEAHAHRHSPPPRSLAPAREPPRLTPPLPDVRLPHAFLNDAVDPEPLGPPPFALASLGAPTHAPAELEKRAARLAEAGVDLVLTRTTIAARTMDDLARDLSPVTRIARPASGQGVRITDLPRGSLLRAAGIEAGDMVTAVNGFGLTTPEEALAAYANVIERRAAVVELVRAGRLVVLEVTLRSSDPTPTLR